MRRMSRTLSFALRASSLVLAALAGCGSVDVSTPSEANPLDAEEAALITALNADRKAAGLPVVTPCTSMNVIASAHSDDMRNNNYLSDTTPAGVSARDRACQNGYKPACSTSTAYAELVASGLPDGKGTYDQWKGDAKTAPVLMAPTVVVAGVGRATGGKVPVWTVDLASVSDATCN